MAKKPPRSEKIEPSADEAVETSQDEASLKPETTTIEEAIGSEEGDHESTDTDNEPIQPVSTGNSSLLDEVEAFFHQREELAEKLAREIEATENRLAELQQTMAQLYPDRAATPSKDRRPKKVKKSPPRNPSDQEQRKSGD